MSVKHRVKVNGDSWVIKVVDLPEMSTLREDGDELAGLCVPQERRIYILETCVDPGTIKHEVYHAYWSYLHLDDTNNLHVTDVEEIGASHFSAKGEEMIKKSKTIYKALKKKMEEQE
jgi:hypothetical protein